MLTQILNGRILTPKGWIRGGSVIIDGNKIIEVSNNELHIESARFFDAAGCYIVPGGIDIHVHGGGGRDFMEGTEEAFRKAINAHMFYGTTSILPTLSSSTVPMIKAAVRTTEKLMAQPDSPVLGLHLEGPYFNKEMAGGQLPENIKDPTPMDYRPLLDSTNSIKRWDEAPELPGTVEFGRTCVEHGVLPCVAHTQANYHDVRTAYEVGFTHATHFYNAMPGFHKNHEYKYEGTVESVYLIDEPCLQNKRTRPHRTHNRCSCMRSKRFANSIRSASDYRGRRVQACRPLGSGRQYCHHGQTYTHNGAESGDSFGGSVSHGIGNTGKNNRCGQTQRHTRKRQGRRHHDV